jgi:hypothetical protein
MEVGTRRLLHFNVTRHPTADWTLRQFRECVAGDEGYRYLIHDRDSIYPKELDASLNAFGAGCLENAVQSAAGKLVLRTADWNSTSRMSGF